MKTVTLIAGPTAGGKSQHALEIAKAEDGIIINADSMQVYDGLRVLTARPGDEDMQGVPHYLYGHVPPEVNYSTGQWLRDVKDLLSKTGDRPVIFVGGTGLYFKALLEGLAEIPDVPDGIRTKMRAALQEKGTCALYEELKHIDALTAAKLAPHDGQRISRALEVFEASGKPLSYWQNAAGAPLIDPCSCRKIVLLPERSYLYQRINRRFDHMVEEGALEEVKALYARGLDAALPVMKAIGVPEFGNFLQGISTLDEAIEKAKTRTRNYAKRQMTWFRHQLDESWVQN